VAVNDVIKPWVSIMEELEESDVIVISYKSDM